MTLPTRDELAEILRTAFDAVVKEADDWRPVAGYILGVIRVCAKPEETIKTLADLADYLVLVNGTGVSEIRTIELGEELHTAISHYRKLFNDGT